MNKKELVIPKKEQLWADIACNNWNYPSCATVRLGLSHRGEALHLEYRVVESNTQALCTEINGPVWQDSCVEFFCSFDGKSYYNLEFNCIGTVHAAHGRDRDRRELLAPEQLEKLLICPSLGTAPVKISGECQWGLAVEIPVTLFDREKLTSFAGLTIAANFYKCGDKLPQPHYLSWSPIKTEKPDFHRPEFFGKLTYSL